MAQTTKIHDGKTKPIIVTDTAYPGGHFLGTVGTGGGGGGGAVTVADGADTAQGTTTDAGIITDANGTVIGFLRGAIKLWITHLARMPAALGSTTAAASLPVTLSTDGPFVTQTGALTETAPASDTASSGLNGRLQRVAQRLTSLIALFPTALGTTTAANSLPVTLASDSTYATLQGGVTETAPATDTASSGANGRLQRIAQNITTMIAATLKAQLQAGTANAANMGGITNIISATLTRPANTTTYTAGREMADTGNSILTLTNIATKSGGSGVIQQVTASCSSNGATKPQLELWVFDTTQSLQASADNNATAFPLTDPQADTHICVIPLTTSYIGDATANTGNFIMDTGQINEAFLTNGSANLFMRIIVRNAYTPGANSETWKFKFHVQQDL